MLLKIIENQIKACYQRNSNYIFFKMYKKIVCKNEILSTKISLYNILLFLIHKNKPYRLINAGGPVFHCMTCGFV